MTPTPAAPHTPTESVKETLISIVIAFALAFVFRGFVIEAFVIPTGSMAPTLMGAHMRFQSPASGYSWPVGPWEGLAGRASEYAPVQGAGNSDPITVHDPISGELIDKKNVPLRSGDRILVLKYLYAIMEPSRFDVIVFKNPTSPGENYIKRLIGLPREEVALVDGDVFTRAMPDGAVDLATDSWEAPGWTIARKNALEQRAVWQTIFDAAYTPLESGSGAASFIPPWNSGDKGAWKMDGGAGGLGTYTLDAALLPALGGGGKRSELFFDQTRTRFGPLITRNIERGEKWTIDDRYPYDEVPTPGSPLGPGSFQRMPRFPVADLRMRAGIEPTAAGLMVEATIRARGYDFQALIDCAGKATLRMRPIVGDVGVIGAWQELAMAAIGPVGPGAVANIEFWHADQRLQLWIDGQRVLEHTYDWSPAERILNATGRTLAQIMNDPSAKRINPLLNTELYRRRAADVRWAFNGGVRVHRAALDRDLYYQPGIRQNSGNNDESAGLGTAPTSPLVLGKNQFFVCGDNSPQSLDGRLWDSIDSWVATEFGPPVGIVPRELLLGKAFFVYWPSLIKDASGVGVPVPDFGRMRLIW